MRCTRRWAGTMYHLGCCKQQDDETADLAVSSVWPTVVVYAVRVRFLSEHHTACCAQQLASRLRRLVQLNSVHVGRRQAWRGAAACTFVLHVSQRGSCHPHPAPHVPSDARYDMATWTNEPTGMPSGSDINTWKACAHNDV